MVQSSVLSFERDVNSVVKSLYPRLALLEALVGFRDEHQRREPSGDEICEARRDFLDAFAYLCDIEKGGATVTAAGLQKLLHSNILWLAANEGIRKDVETYAEVILRTIRGANLETQEAVQEDIFQLAVEKCKARIEFYKDEMQRYATRCRMRLRSQNQDEIVRSLRSRLKKLSEPPRTITPAAIIGQCYAMRGDEVKKIKERSTDPEDEFSKLAHYLGRLGATRSSANAVVRGMIKVPALHQISEIRTVNAPSPREVTIDQEYLSPYEIVWAICKDSTLQNPMQIRSALLTVVDLDLPTNDKIRTRLASRNTIVTRVHAELQVADRFSRDKYMEFVDGDRYVGCSKPACYFCHSWFSTHRHKYARPATHHKIIPGCRGPDNGLNEVGTAILKEMYGKICGKLDQDILDCLLSSENGDTHRRRGYMSTEGSSRAPSRISQDDPATIQ
ncbi:hypothetical protein B0O99DRAFT_654495 [Bisporella sp. PMI_857]|nr:hypothetical protein B0O99DRAFT_654495 [Bisporella sp. PMI_857]